MTKFNQQIVIKNFRLATSEIPSGDFSVVFWYKKQQNIIKKIKWCSSWSLETELSPLKIRNVFQSANPVYSHSESTSTGLALTKKGSVGHN